MGREVSADATGKANEVSEAVRKAVDARPQNGRYPNDGGTLPARVGRLHGVRPKSYEAGRHQVPE